MCVPLSLTLEICSVRVLDLDPASDMAFASCAACHLKHISCGHAYIMVNLA